MHLCTAVRRRFSGLLQISAGNVADLRPVIAALTALVVVLVTACSGRDAEQAAVMAPPFKPVMNNHQLMAWVLEPAVDVIWDSAGTIITAEGRQELAPTTDEGWAAVERAAATLAEGANLLMLPGRAAGADWLEYSLALVASSQLAQEAAGAQDADALFDAGGRIYQVCRACHNQYWVREEG
jgi:hypothetical protein